MCRGAVEFTLPLNGMTRPARAQVAGVTAQAVVSAAVLIQPSVEQDVEMVLVVLMQGTVTFAEGQAASLHAASLC